MIQFGGRGNGKALTEIENFLKRVSFSKEQIYMTKDIFDFSLRWFPDHFKYIDGKWYKDSIEVKIIGGKYD